MISCSHWGMFGAASLAILGSRSVCGGGDSGPQKIVVNDDEGWAVAYDGQGNVTDTGDAARRIFRDIMNEHFGPRA